MSSLYSELATLPFFFSKISVDIISEILWSRSARNRLSGTLDSSRANKTNSTPNVPLRKSNYAQSDVCLVNLAEVSWKSCQKIVRTRSSVISAAALFLLAVWKMCGYAKLQKHPLCEWRIVVILLWRNFVSFYKVHQQSAAFPHELLLTLQRSSRSRGSWKRDASLLKVKIKSVSTFSVSTNLSGQTCQVKETEIEIVHI